MIMKFSPGHLTKVREEGLGSILAHLRCSYN